MGLSVKVCVQTAGAAVGVILTAVLPAACGMRGISLRVLNLLPLVQLTTLIVTVMANGRFCPENSRCRNRERNFEEQAANMPRVGSDRLPHAESCLFLPPSAVRREGKAGDALP